MARPKRAAKRVPDWVRAYIAGLKADEQKFCEREQFEAGLAIQKAIDTEEDEEIREVMQRLIAEETKQHTMLLTYILSAYLPERVRKLRWVKQRMQPIALYIALENITAHHADSSGYTKQDSMGRCPLRISDEERGFRRLYHVLSDIPPLKFANSWYAFGVHNFNVGAALRGIIAHLEDRYALDFKELERQRVAQQQQKKD